ncbi:fumarylacetoacetate hydrolase family protein [Bosea sp. (in: a-proteobacteria)]|jgi:2-keto-4-pentenoate hydratase|uniref:fumarylacetoacetate hydrolase family protein n=1 Tax=Bosea sp. (in: a-proteobacteria) TaxID=1871050 RepID=UPI003F72EFAC
MPTTTETSLRDAFVRARRSRSLVDIETLPVPADLESAMTVQADVSSDMGYAHQGWKVSISDGRGIVGLMPGPFLKPGDTYRSVPGAELRVEIELAIRLGRDMPRRPGKPYSRAELLEHCHSACVGVEIVESRIADWTQVPFPLWLADGLGHGGYLIGQDVPFEVFDEIGDLTCTVELDGDVLHDKPAVHANGDPLAPVLAWANRKSESALGGLVAGQVITTGSLCGGVLAPTLGPVIVRLDPLAAISFALA